MSTATVEATLQYVIDGKVRTMGVATLPEGRHYKVEVLFEEVDCTCPEPEEPMSEQKAFELYGPPPEGDEDPNIMSAVTDPGETSRPVYPDWELTLDSLLPGTVIADKDHDDWTKFPSGEWRTFAEGPSMRAKTLAALWAPFTIVRTPEVQP